MQTNNRGFFLLGATLISACALVYLCGWHIPLMEIDAIQYANIAREMLKTGHFLEIYDRGKDYLDKPPMLFWISALSMKIFGVSDWAYRLPSYLFALLAVYSTYKLAALFYKKEIAMVSAIVLASCQALFLITHDVRTDTMLMAWVALAIWQLAAWYRDKSWKRIIIIGIALAGGLMTKGPIALIVPAFCFAVHFFLRREFKPFFRWEYIPMLVITGILLIPMCIGLYNQYDLHPGKIIDGLTIKSGLRFFFWTQSFGRITGESQWHENDSFFFLFQNMLWSFLPWIIFFVIGLVRDVRRIFQVRFKLPEGEEWITTGGFLLTYCALGISRYQLPHYIFVVFPLAAIITGKAVYGIFVEAREKVRGRKALFVVHTVIFILLWVALITLLFFPFPDRGRLPGIFAVVAFCGWILLLIRWRKPQSRLLLLAVSTIVCVNFFLDIGFYPHLLDYQLHHVIMTGMKQHDIAPDQLNVYGMDEERALDFYTRHRYAHVDNFNGLKTGDCVMVNQKVLDSLGPHPGWSVVYRGKYFHVSTLDIQFINPDTRDGDLTPVYILRKEP